MHVRMLKPGVAAALVTALIAVLTAAPGWAATCEPVRDTAREAQTGPAAPAPVERRPLAQPAAIPTAALAQAPAPAPAPLVAAPPPPSPAPASTPPQLGAPAETASLDGARGTGGITTEATLGGVVSGNSATNVVTGANTIQASSFAGATGIPIVIQNTGANVLIQNATVINLQFTQ